MAKTAQLGGNFGTRSITTTFNQSSAAPLYFLALFTKTGADPTYAVWLGISNGTVLSNNAVNIGLANNNFSMRMNTSPNGDFGSYTSDTQVLVVGKLEFDTSGLNETMTVWINPTGVETATLSNSIAGQDVGWVNPAYALTGNYVLSGDSGLIDNIKIGSSWADVAAVPEPSAAALLGLAGLTVMLRRRR